MVLLIAGLKWLSEGMLVGVAYKLRGNYTFKECRYIGKIGDGRIVVDSRWGFLRMGRGLGYLEMVGNSARLKRQIDYISEGGDQI